MASAPAGRLLRVARLLGVGALDLAIPRRCGLCGRFDTFLCDVCSRMLPPALPPRCPTCWDVLIPGQRCRTCATVLIPALSGVRSTYRLEEGARALVHALKYDGLSALAQPMAGLMATTLAGWGIAPDLIAPVPLHRSRQRRRGFNQAELLARALAATAELPMEPGLLQRVRATAPQVRTVSVEVRRQNVAGAFAVRPGGAAGRSLLLIDDITTTGATLRACAEALRAAGAGWVYALTFARED